MTYTGHVDPGGAAAVRELPHLVISKISVGPMDNNSYLLRCRRTGEQVLIDAAADPARLLDLIGPDGIAAVITTHRHRDHWGALAAVVAATGATTVAHADDAEAIDPPTVTAVRNGDELFVGDAALKVIHLVGHTPGSIALAYDDPEGHAHIFTGDSLFPGGIGNTFGDPGAFEQLLTDVSERIFSRYPDTTWVYPGHGDDTTLGAERAQLDEWAQRGW